MDEGSPVNVGRMTMSTHSGTHADAPLHYSQEGIDAASMELDPYIGTCLVIDARGVSGEIDVADLPHIDSVDRVLFRTWDAFPHEEWRSDHGIRDQQCVIVYPGNVHLANRSDIETLYDAVARFDDSADITLVRTGVGSPSRGEFPGLVNLGRVRRDDILGVIEASE